MKKAVNVFCILLVLRIRKNQSEKEETCIDKRDANNERKREREEARKVLMKSTRIHPATDLSGITRERKRSKKHKPQIHLLARDTKQ